MTGRFTQRGCYVIAEAGLNHNGSLKEAKALISIAAEAGADCVKFQKRNVSTLATESELNKRDSRFPSLGNTYREIRESLEFDTGELKELKIYASEHSLDFMVTPFDVPSLEVLENVGVEFYKVASHGVTNIPLLEMLSDIGKPVVLSSGMSTLKELDKAVMVLDKNPGNLVAILHCISSYPTPNSEINLRLIDQLGKRYKKRIGYSGHELGGLASLAAVARGATVIERHFTRDCNQEGFDHHMSLDPNGLTTLIHDVRQLEVMLGDGEKRVLESEMIARNKYRLSMVATRNLKEGEPVFESDVEFRNPGTGISPEKAPEFYGQRLTKPAVRGELVTEDMFYG